ncbi:hypothetical protein FHX42_000336 [Saccharopolyspora lacisalsi]|uniref:Peptidase inhibitor family I36 n=1 Tax=Halosaccharopolyspora lacisalsi TaxID=1000566 RepID=A0A839DUD3_9PSEU|nr:peptidase inhibitor family I36 protein [Halosaccharopolyspora lacisalsi]MBA8823007.1 hypothetical protein [Halosaccharopolyspora lacisalsi]
MKRHRNPRILVAALFAASVGTASAGTAVAAEPPEEISPGLTGDYDDGRGFDNCPQNTYCLYDEADFNQDNSHARYWWLRGTAGDLAELADGGFSDRAASVVNRTGGPICLFSEYLDGNCLKVDAHTAIHDLDQYEFYDENSDGVSSVPANSSVDCDNPIS